jgi:hypothetical protein
MDLSDSRNLFEDAPRNKSHNDADNGGREDIIQDLFSPDERIREKYLRHRTNGEFWKGIQQGFDEALRSFRSAPRSKTRGNYISSLEKAAGRNKRFDYIAKTYWADDSSGLKLEFKRGDSIFHQPQFLSLYAKQGTLTHADVTSYPEFLLDNFGFELETIAREKLPTKTEYIKYVFGTKYDAKPFFLSLYNASKTDSRANLLGLQYRSIDAYLRLLGTKEIIADSTSFQRELNSQVEKIFVSWDTANQKFNVEQFTSADITLNGSVSLKAGNNGFNAVEFENLAGNKISALLRWKNGPCVLGPAWQISLKVGSPREGA